MDKLIKYGFLFLLLVSVFACKTSKEINDGSLAFKLKKYQLAKTLLSKEIASGKEQDKLKIQLKEVEK